MNRMPRDFSRPALPVGALHKVSLRERLKSLYFLLFGPRFSRCIFAASVMLLVVSFFHSASVLTLWYHVVEGILTFLFVGEIALRLAVMRSNFWESAFNVTEVVACVVCLHIFFILHFFSWRSSRAEHQVLILLRYLGQVLRLAGVITQDRFVFTGSEGGIHLFAQNGLNPAFTDAREMYRDVL